ncbi:hypothetical protein VP01_1310g3 [Puccinia sorghi]|uniref:OBG-type G domain-containing protein n=1 Tax=Puccinia sorghi TaxID=27349 RepID=A0A0L6VMY1_9BASI|nr:hypothetical protein VP01_1310g3 [Puccinia sorghi]
MSTAVEKIKAIEDEMAKTQKVKQSDRFPLRCVFFFQVSIAGILHKIDNNRTVIFSHLLCPPGQLKAKLAKLKRELLTPSSGGGGGGGVGFDVARTGVASVGFVGFPSVGKSSLMSGLTGTQSAVAAYEFTTLTTVPGTMNVRGASIQILDLPGIIEGAKDGKGRGRQVIAGHLRELSSICNHVSDLSLFNCKNRSCNLLFIVLDVLKPLDDKRVIENELEVINSSSLLPRHGFGIRLNKKPPNIIIKKKDKGGISISNTVPLTKLEPEEIKAVLAEYRMSNCDVAFRCDATLDDLIDVIEGNRRSSLKLLTTPLFRTQQGLYALPIRSVSVASTITGDYSCRLTNVNYWCLAETKLMPYQSKSSIYCIESQIVYPYLSKSGCKNIDELIDALWYKLDLVRVYTKPRGRQPDYSQPVVLKTSKCTVEDFCNAIHKEIAKQMKYSGDYEMSHLIFIFVGTSAKHARGQKVGLEHVLDDEDVVTISALRWVQAHDACAPLWAGVYLDGGELSPTTIV